MVSSIGNSCGSGSSNTHLWSLENGDLLRLLLLGRRRGLEALLHRLLDVDQVLLFARCAGLLRVSVVDHVERLLSAGFSAVVESLG